VAKNELGSILPKLDLLGKEEKTTRGENEVHNNTSGKKRGELF